MLTSHDPLFWPELAVVVTTVLILFWHYREFLADFTRFCTTYVGLCLILFVLYAIVYAQLGTGLGVHYLFWHDDFFARACTSLGVTVLLGVIGVIAYYLDPFPWATDQKTSEFLHGDEQIKHVVTAWWSRLLPGLVARSIALPPQPSRPSRLWDYLRFGFNALIDPVSVTPLQSWLDPTRANALRLQRFLRAARGPFLLLLLAPAVLPSVFSAVPRTAPTGHIGFEPPPVLDVSRHLGGYALGVVAWLIGIDVGVLLIKMFIRSSTLFYRPELPVHGAVVTPPAGSPGWVKADAHCPRSQSPGGCAGAGCPRGARTLGVEPPTGCRARKQLRFGAVVFGGLFLVTYFIMGLIRFFRSMNWLPNIGLLNFTPAVAVCASFAFFAMVYALIASQKRWLQVPMALALVAWIGIANHDPFKNRFEKMSYATKDRVDLRKAVKAAYFDAPDEADEANATALVDDHLARYRWKGLAKPGEPDVVDGRPKLVLVAVSGGATRSAYWSAVMLDRLERDVPGFGRRVRVISGASGGMLGTACYVTYRRDVAEGRYVERLGAKPAEGDKPAEVSNWVKDVPVNSMDPLARYMTLSEMGKALWPFDVGEDRGVVLEKDWGGLRYPMAKLADLESRGRVPSLIFSPMIVEDGRRLLISNLDLSRDDNGHLAAMLLTQGRQVSHDRTSSPDGIQDQLSSLSGVEYFRLFPRSKDGEIYLSTAVRMSATFPFVSPAVSLPSAPPRRVVDAGYYDNYGVQVALAWTRQNREWLSTYTSGVLLVQIRDSSSVRDRLDVDDAPATFWDKAGRGFEFFTTPVEAMSKARFTTSSFRNDTDVMLLNASARDFMKEKVADPDSFFATVIFENSAAVTLTHATDFWHELDDLSGVKPQGTNFDEVAMSWYLTRGEQDATRRAIPDDPPEGSHWLKAEDRQALRETLQDQVFGTGPGDHGLPPGHERDLRLKRLEQLRNYEKLANLKSWWTHAGKLKAGSKTDQAP